MLSFQGITALSFANKVVKVQPQKFVRSLYGVRRTLQYNRYRIRLSRYAAGNIKGSGQTEDESFTIVIFVRVYIERRRGDATDARVRGAFYQNCASITKIM